MTSTRSDRERISSSSSETSSTARPASRCSSSRLCTNSIAPTSRPRVGWAAIVTRGSSASSRAITTFCWLPPESEPAVVSGSPPRTSYCSSSGSRLLLHALGREQAEAAERRAPVLAQREVLGEREVEDQAAPLAVLGDVADAGGEGAAHAQRR